MWGECLAQDESGVGVDRLNREKIVDRISLDRRYRIDRGVVDEEVKPSTSPASVAFSRLSAARSFRSPATKIARPSPNLWQSERAFEARSEVGRSCRKTRPPLSRSASTMDEPIPPAPPVISAVLPSSPSRTRSSLMSPRRHPCARPDGRIGENTRQ
jgi:hypothetical protein